METMQDYRKRTKHNVQRIKPIKTANGELKLFRDWDHEGAIYMENPKTIKRYEEIINEEPDCDKHGIFWAFSDKQYEEGKEKMRQLGLYTDGQTIYSFGMGGYGVNEKLIDEYFDFYRNRRKRAADECDPQEVYLYEYNNHECMIAWEGDEPAYKIIVDMYGEDIAKGITRFSVMS